MISSDEEQDRIKWDLKEISIRYLKEHPKNPRKIGKEQFERLGNMIDKFGLIDKPICNNDLTIIGGHQRIKYLKKQKEKTVNCWVADRLLSDADVEELLLGLNLHQGSWDFELMANLWEPLDLLKYGFSEEQLLGTCKEAEKIIKNDNEKNSSKKQRCPNCGFEF